jgi:hypothetical protein
MFIFSYIELTLNTAYLRGLANEFGESTNSVRIELNRLKEAGLIQSKSQGNTILYQANTKSSLYPELHAIVNKYLGLDQVVDQILQRLGDVELAFVNGSCAKGIDNGTIDLVLVGRIDRTNLLNYISKTENLIRRKIRPVILTKKEFLELNEVLLSEAHIVLWGRFSH